MRRLELAPLLSALGGLILFVSLFLHWYQPGMSAWTVFEVLDLLLAALAVGVVAVVMANVARKAEVHDAVLPALGIAAFVVVVSQLLNHPPAAQGGSVMGGAWLALAGSALMAAGGILAATEVSLAVSVSPRRREDEHEAPRPPRRRGRPSPANEAADVEPEVHEELYPEHERRGPIGADDPEPWTAAPEDETLSIEADRKEERG